MSEFINLRTGEIVDTTIPRRRGKVASTLQEVGVETKYPADCITADSLLEALRNLDACLHYKPDIKYDYLTDSMVDKMITGGEAAFLTCIGKQLVAWNYWMGNSKDLQKALPGVNISRTLQGLVDKGLLRIAHKDKPFRYDMVLNISPAVAFRGSHVFRDSCLRRWYA